MARLAGAIRAVEVGVQPVLVDTKARPIHIALTPGQRHELIAAPELLAHARGKALIGDTGYDSNEFIAWLWLT